MIEPRRSIPQQEVVRVVEYRVGLKPRTETAGGEGGIWKGVCVVHCQ